MSPHHRPDPADALPRVDVTTPGALVDSARAYGVHLLIGAAGGAG